MLIESEETKEMVLQGLPASISQERTGYLLKSVPLEKVADILSI